MNASVYRNTRFELHTIEQKANSFIVRASERGGAVRPNGVVAGGAVGLEPVAVPELEVHESLFTDTEMQLVHDALALLEERFAAVYDQRAAAPERLHEKVAAAEAAELRLKLAELRVLELEARAAELEASR